MDKLKADTDLKLDVRGHKLALKKNNDFGKRPCGFIGCQDNVIFGA
jgi:hypothetical protein